MGVCNGFAIPLAHKFGAGDYKGMRGFMMNAIYLSAIFAVVMTIVTVIFCMPILELMRTPENIIDGAYRYIVIIFWGFRSPICTIWFRELSVPWGQQDTGCVSGDRCGH